MTCLMFPIYIFIYNHNLGNLYNSSNERLWQIERSNQEHSHLITGDWGCRTVFAATTARCNAFGCQSLNPRGSPIARGNICEYAGSCWRNITGAMLGFEQEDCHLIARHRIRWAIDCTATTSS